MGNGLSGLRLLGNGGRCCHVQLGSSASIYLTEKKVFRTEDGEFHEKWEGWYTVDGSSCRLALTKSRGRIGKSGCVDQNQKLRMSIHDGICARMGLHLQIKKDEAGLLEVSEPGFCGISAKFMSVKTKKTINEWGRIRDTSLRLYGNERVLGLIVIVRKKRTRSGNPYMMTVAHYFATSTVNIFSKADIGLSVVAKIGVTYDGELDFAVDGPVQHPATALIYMFDEVFKTGIWKPSSCPHCANYSIIEKQCSLFLQSDSEDSDDLPAAAPYSQPPLQNPGSILSNNGVIHGNKNGNLFVKTLSLRG